MNHRDYQSAREERQRDIAWIKSNLHIFVPVAREAFRGVGRGAIVVDTTSQPIEGQGNPFGYFPQTTFEQGDDEDTRRIMNKYHPKREFILVLLKPEERTSTYRVQAIHKVSMGKSKQR